MPNALVPAIGVAPVQSAPLSPSLQASATLGLTLVLIFDCAASLMGTAQNFKLSVDAAFRRTSSKANGVGGGKGIRG